MCAQAVQQNKLRVERHHSALRSSSLRRTNALSPGGRSCDEMSATKTKGSVMWRELVGLSLLVVLLGAAMVANVTDPMRDYRGSWLTHASK
jgi:hypothetical protein